MNQVNLIGRLTRDPDVRYTQDQKAVARFSIAINNGYGDNQRTDYPNIVVWGAQAENCEKYLSKGKLVGISGRIQTGSYTNKDGNKVYTTDVVANRVEFLEWGDRQPVGEPMGAAAPQGGPAPAPSKPAEEVPSDFQELEEDVPF